MWNDIKLFLRKHKTKLIIFSLIAFIVIPVVIHVLFKWHSGISWLEAEWSAGDVLAFYGTLLAALIGIVGVFFSIQYAQKNYREDIARQVLPYFVITPLKVRATCAIFPDNANKEEEAEINGIDDIMKQVKSSYEEKEMTSAYIIIKSDKIEFMSDLTKEQRRIIERKGIDLEGSDGNFALNSNPYISCPFYIENAGNGPAVYVSIGFFKEQAEEKYMLPVQIKKDGRFYIHIYSDADIEKINGKYVLSIQYQDIYKNNYSQRFPFTIDKDYNGVLNYDVQQERIKLN